MALVKIESFNGKLGEELLNREVFTTLTQAKVLIAHGKRNVTRRDRRSSLGYRPPAPEAITLLALA